MFKLNFKDILQNKKFLKAFSVVAGLSLWLFVTSSRPIVVEERIPLKVIVPDGKTILEESNPLEIIVKFKGPRLYLQGLRPEFLGPIINLSRGAYKDRDLLEVQVKESDFHLPNGVVIEDFRPKSIRLKLDKKVVRKVQIIPVYQNKIEEGLKLMEGKITPNTGLIEGPQEILKNIDVILTRPIDLSGLNGQGEFPVPLEAPEDRVVVKNPKLMEATFQYDIRSLSSNMQFEKVKIRFLSSSGDFTSDNYFVRVQVQSTDGEGSLNDQDVQVVADIPEGKKGEFWVDLKTILPPGVQLTQLLPKKIKVRVK